MKKQINLLIILIIGFISCETEDPIPTYTLAITMSPTEGGKVTVLPKSSNYKEGDVVTLTPEPNEHWSFQKWDGDGSGSSTPLQLTMNSNKSVLAVFIKRNYPLKITIQGEGTVEEKIVANPSGKEYPHGTTVELTPQPKEGWVFESWGGDLTGTETPKTIKVDKEKNVIAKFKRRDYPLNISIEGEGIVEEKIITNPSGRTYPFETVVELTPKPKEGWLFERWGGELSGTEFPKNIKVDKEKNVTVKFIRNQTITSLDCSSAINNGTLTSGVTVSDGVNIIIPYSGAFGGTHNGQIVASTGITGLTATLAPGTFANGSGNLTYIITGTPTAAGIASFAINIGGKTCTLTRSVAAAQPQYPTGSVFGPSGPTHVVDVTNPITGRTWMDRNLGATRAATSSTDVNSYGDLYQWGRRADGHQLRNSKTRNTQSPIDQPSHGDFITKIINPWLDWRNPSNINLWQGVNGKNNPCPSGYRLPTDAELNAERLSWRSNKSEGAFDSPLKLPMAGFRRYWITFEKVGSGGYYWSSTGITGSNSRILAFDSNDAKSFTNYRARGLSVRCIKD
jgi:hypothetical protein